MGLFNKNGDIVVPAEYNDITRVRNGMIIALKGAEKKNNGVNILVGKEEKKC
ncbi:MAG: WG repeat-containing protein [Ferruginibacter sp.]